MTLKVSKYVPGKEVKPQTAAQAAASRENFAIFILKGMRGQISQYHLQSVLNNEQFWELRAAVNRALSQAQAAQTERMRKAGTKRRTLSAGSYTFLDDERLT